jgi:hypothetical protein
MKYSTGSCPYSVVIGKFNADTHLDIVVANLNGNTVSVLLGYPDTAFTNQMMLTTGKASRPRALATSDFNNDRELDIVIANSGVNNVGIFLGYGNGSFANQATYSTGSYPLSVAVGDFNNDTRLDIVVANFGSNNVGVLLGHGNGSFANQTTYLTDSAPQFVAVSDFNNDSFLDIIVAISDINKIGIFLGYGNGTFGDLVKFAMGYGSSPFFVVVGDFNNDEKVDFAVINNGTDSLKIVLQTC